MPAPTNITAAAAIALTPGTTVTQDVYDAGTSYDVFYKIAAADHDRVFGIAAWGTFTGSAATDYWPLMQFYADEALTLFVAQQVENGSVTLPVPAGLTLYIKVLSSADVTPSILNIKLVEASRFNAQIGDVFISAASIDSWMVDAGYTGLHAGAIDPATSTLRGYVPQFVTGEHGDLLPTSGRILFGDEGGIFPVPPSATIDYYLNLYDPPNYDAVLTRVLIPDSPFGAPRIRTHLATEKFYVLARFSAGNTNTFYTVDADGTRSAGIAFARGGLSTWTFAVNNDETVMYLAMTNGTVRQLNMSTLVQSAFVAAVAGYNPKDLVVMPDGSIVVAYLKSSGTRDMFLRRYNAAGATLGTFTPALSMAITPVDPRIGYSSDDDAVWLFNHLDDVVASPTYGGGWADVRKVQVSTMTQIGAASVTPDGYQGFIPTDTPVMPTTSDSCPIIEIRFAMVPPEDDEEDDEGDTPGDGDVTVDTPHLEPCLTAPPTVNCWSGGTPSVNAIATTPTPPTANAWATSDDPTQRQVGLLNSDVQP